MKTSILITVLFLLIGSTTIGQYEKLLKKHFSEEMLLTANTAINEDYLTQDEIETIQVLNLARVYPQEFADFYLDFLAYHEDIGYTFFSHGLKEIKKKDRYFYTLYKELSKMDGDDLELLQPCLHMYDYAECWAKEMGQRNVTGHNRKKCDDGNFGECCSYMDTTDPVEHIFLLLIDEDIKDLGHRDLMFSPVVSVGVSFAPHKEYGKGFVMDFTYESPVNDNIELVSK